MLDLIKLNLTLMLLLDMNINPFDITFEKTEDGYNVTFTTERELTDSEWTILDALIKQMLNDKQRDTDKMDFFLQRPLPKV